MATPSSVSKELRRMLAAYPQHAAKLEPAQVAAMLEVWQEDLIDLSDDLLIAACRNHRERSQWLPSIAEIRASAVSLMRQASPANQNAAEAWGTVKAAIRHYGYMGVTTYDEATGRWESRRPAFENPAIEATVRRIGWQEICMDEGPEGVIRAQFERMYEAEIERMENKVTQSPAVRDFIAAMMPASNQLPAPGAAQDIVKRIAEAKRL